MPNKDYIEKNTGQMYQAILKLNNEEECDNLFKDMCTIQELAAIAQRYTVAKMLNENAKYVEIVEATGASSATISRVKRSLENGKGYEIVFRRLNETRGRKKRPF